MQVTNSQFINNNINVKQMQPCNSSFCAAQNAELTGTNLPSVNSAGLSMVNSNLPIAYSKIGEIQIPGLDQKAIVYKLANGQKVVIAPKQGPTIVKTSYNVGSMNETDDIRGISHYIEHNLFNGSKDLASGEYDKKVSALGGMTNANTSYATTNYFLKLQLLNDNSLEEAIKLNALQTQFPTFPTDQLEKEKEPVKSEIDMYKDMPEDVSMQNVLKDLFGVHTKSTDFILGTKENINSLTREKVLEYYNTWYTPDNAITVITGDVNPDETIALVSKYYNKPNDYSQVNKRYSEPIQYLTSTKRTDIILPNANSAIIAMGFAIPEGTSQKDLNAIDTLISLLSSPSSRFYKAIDKMGATCEFSEEKIQNKPNSAKAKTIQIHTTEENIEELLNAVYQEITYIANNPPSQQELDNIKNQKINSIKATSESSESLNFLISDNALDNNYDWWNSSIRNISSLTPQDICEAARKYLDLNKTAICVSHEKTATAESIQKNYSLSQAPGKTVSFGASIKPSVIIDNQTQQVQTYKLPNNIQTTIIPGNKQAKSVMNIRFESDDLNSVPQGALSVLSILLNRGSLTSGNDIYNSIKAQNDFKLDFFAGLNGITVSSTHNGYDMQTVMSLFKETLTNPNFSVEEFERAKKLVKDQIQSEEISGVDNIYRTLFPSITCFADKEQRLKELDTLTLADIQRLYSFILASSKVNASLTADIVQNPSIQEIFTRELSTGIGVYKPYTLERPASYHVYQPITAPKIITQADERLQAEVVQAYTYPKAENIDDIAKIYAIDNILGGSMSSRLYKDLRENEKLAYSVSSFPASVKDTDAIFLTINTTTDSPDPKEGSPENITKALNGFNRNIELLKTQNVSNEELENYKNKAKTIILNQLETNIGKTYAFSDPKDTYYDIRYYQELYKAIDRLTPESIRYAANYIFKNPPITSIVASQKTLDSLNLQ